MTTKRALAAGAGVTAVAATIASSLLTGTAAASTQKISVHMHPVSDTSIDNGKSGFSAGDDDVQTTRLSTGGKVVGWEAGECLTTRVAATADQLCRFVFHLKRGQIVAEGAVRAGESGPGTFALAITGGTGAYDTAHGHVDVTATSGSSVPVVIYVRTCAGRRCLVGTIVPTRQRSGHA